MPRSPPDLLLAMSSCCLRSGELGVLVPEFGDDFLITLTLTMGLMHTWGARRFVATAAIWEKVQFRVKALDSNQEKRNVQQGGENLKETTASSLQALRCSLQTRRNDTCWIRAHPTVPKTIQDSPHSFEEVSYKITRRLPNITTREKHIREF